LGEHLAQRRIFSAHEREFMDGDFRKVLDEGGHDVPIFVCPKMKLSEAAWG